MIKVNRIERGWAGHFICASRCMFRRNTLLEFNEIKIVVSTVGLMRNSQDNGYEEIGLGRYFETMAFHALKDDLRYHDADVERPVSFNSDWQISELDADDKANVMHEKVVDEIMCGLICGDKYESRPLN